MMKKTLLTLATIVTASVLSMAADCSGGAAKCTEDTDCKDGEICQIDADAEEGLCSVSFPVCAEDVDCDLSNSESPSFAVACTDAASCSTGQPESCRLDDNSDACECIEDGVGETYCVLTPEADDSCVVGSSVSVDGKDVCLIDANETCDEDGQCISNS